MWLSVDLVAKAMPGWSPYVISFDNQKQFVDPDGKPPPQQKQLECQFMFMEIMLN